MNIHHHGNYGISKVVTYIDLELCYCVIRAGSGHFGSQQPSLVLVSCEIGSDLGSIIKLFFPKFLAPLRNLRPFLFVIFFLDKTPREN